MAFVSGFYKLITKKSLLKNVKKKEESNRVVSVYVKLDLELGLGKT